MQPEWLLRNLGLFVVPCSATELLVALHLPVVLWFAVAYPYMGGTLRSHERRMDFVRLTGELVIYYVLIALGGGVLLGLTALILEPIGPDLVERVIEWVLASNGGRPPTSLSSPSGQRPSSPSSPRSSPSPDTSSAI